MSTRAWRNPLPKKARIEQSYILQELGTAAPQLLLTTPHTQLLPPQMQKALPEGSVQALTFELEEGQVGLGYSLAEVIAAEGNGNEDGAGDQAEL